MSDRFVELVKRAFSFLENAGFRLTKSDPGQVQYESDKSFVVAGWDSHSGELNAFVGLLPRTGRAQEEYSLADVMGVAGVPEADCKLASVGDGERLEPFVDNLAADLRSHGQLALAGNRMYFRRLETFRATKAERYMREMNLRKVRSQADEAWHDQQYDRVETLYASVEGELTESESRKLDYARKHRSG